MDMYVCVYTLLYIYTWFIYNNSLCAKHWTKCPTSQQSGFYYHHPHFPSQKTGVQRDRSSVHHHSAKIMVSTAA